MVRGRRIPERDHPHARRDGPAGHASGGLRMRRHQRGVLRLGLPRTRSGRLRSPVFRLGAGFAGDVPDLEVRQRRAEAAVATRYGCWQEDRLLRTDRTRPRVRPSQHVHPRQEGRQRLDHQRREDVDHERPDRRRRRRVGRDRGGRARFRRTDRHPRIHGQRDQAQGLAADEQDRRAGLRQPAAARRRRTPRGQGPARPTVVPERGAFRHPVWRARRRPFVL